MVLEFEIDTPTVPLTSVVLGELVEVSKKMNKRGNAKESFTKLRKDAKDYDRV